MYTLFFVFSKLLAWSQHRHTRKAKERQQGQGGAKGGRKGGPRGGKNKGGQDCASVTPDGKKICFKFNDKGRGCNAGRCPFLHVCGTCFKDHPMFRCDS